MEEESEEVAISTSLLIDDQLCFALYAASRSVTAVYRPLLDRLGLTYPQYLVMLVLWERRTCSVKQIGETLRLDYGTLTPLLKRLEALGHVQRRRRVDDERGVDVTLTERGWALHEQAADLPAELSSAFALSAGQISTLRGLLRLLSASTAAHVAARSGVAPARTS